MNRATTILSASLAALLLGGGASWWIVRSSRDTTLSPSQQAYQVIQKSKVTIPAITSSEAMSSSDLPPELQPLLSGRITSMRAVVYEGGATGYVIITRVPGSLSVSRLYQTQERTLLVDHQWSFISGQRSEAFSLLELATTNYQVRLMYEPRKDGEVQVSAEVINK